MKLKLLLFLTLILLARLSYGTVNEETVVGQNGRLQVKGSRIANEKGDTISLAGMSLFWSQWAGGFYNENCIQWLARDWKCNIVRAAMGIESGGYLVNSAAEKQKIETVVNACIKAGIYVIIDWHDHNATDHKAQAIAFFQEMATKYGSYPNVIYEIFNEPLQVSWSNVIKPYAVDVVNAIREIDPDNLILVGNSSWDQAPLDCANDPITDNNIAYTFHFYVGQHNYTMSSNPINAMKKGVAVFVSEWGLWGKDTDLDSWIQFMKDNKLSWCNWAVNTKVEDPSALKLGASEQGGWDINSLTDIGIKIRHYMQNWGPEIKKAPKLQYAQITYPSNEINLHFSEDINLSEGVDTAFAVLGNKTYPIDTIVTDNVNKSHFIIRLVDTLYNENLELIYKGKSITNNASIHLPEFEGYKIISDSAGAAPVLTLAVSDTNGNFIRIQFNKAMNPLAHHYSGFKIWADKVLITDSIFEENAHTFLIYTKKFYNEQYVYMSYNSSEVQAQDGGLLNAIDSMPIENNAFSHAPKIISATTLSANKIELSFDKAIKYNGTNNDLSVLVYNREIVDTFKVTNISKSLFLLTLSLDKFLRNTDSIRLDYKNFKISGFDSPYFTEDTGLLEVTNTLHPIIEIKKNQITRIEAENYSVMSGIQTENTTDTGGGINLGYIDSNDWMDYLINVIDTGIYGISFRVAAESSAGTVIVRQTSPVAKDLLSLKLPVTGGWQTWKTASGNFQLSTVGEQTLRIFVKTGGWNINWFEFSEPVETSVKTTENEEIFIYPALIKDGIVNLRLKPDVGNASLNIINIAGQPIYSRKLEALNRNAQLNLPENIKSGTYFCILKTTNRIYKQKIMILK